ncbi:MAG: hypothetical protein KBS70_07035 [Bacteroidales bacterium]|nr:hypothetical protein [Candidatus Colicola equi]
MYGASKVSPQHMNNARYWYINANNYNLIETRFWDGLSTKALPYTEIAEIVDTPHGFSFNGENYNYERLSGDIQETIEVLQFEGHRSVPRYHTCNYFIIEDNGTEILHLVPCLTETNEACMIDLLSGELYRNQGSGAFSVEGECLYEFETPAINRIMKKPSIVVRLRGWIKSNREGDKINVDFPLNPNTPIKAKIMLNMSEQYPHNGRHFFRFDGYDYAFYGNGNEVNPIRLAVWSVYSQYNKNYVAKNGATEVEFYSDRVITEFGNYTWNASRMSMMLQKHIGDAQCQDIIIGEVWQDGVFHLHPCDILLHPTLPPQSAMIDLLTGKLYTNQGTGQFTCEGEDLGIWTDTMLEDMRIKDTKADMVVVKQNGEPRVVWERVQPWTEHRWLKGDGVAYVIVNDFSDNVRFKAMSDNGNNYLSFHEDDINRGFIGVIGDKQILRFNTDTTNYEISNIGEEISIANHNNVNGVLLSKNIKYIWRLLGGGNGYKAMINYYNSDTIHLTPCQLTRNLLPSEIASSNTALRGECGFADKEKYKRGEPWFYGNVASSGSFSVSDE